MKIVKEFKEFATKGNIMDMAVGLVIGGAFQAIIKSLVEDVIMPFTALFTGSVDYTKWVIHVSNAEIRIGSFITALINFLIIALSIFIALKVVMEINKRMERVNKDVAKKLHLDNDKKEEEKEPETKECPYCLSEINFKATRCPHCTSELKVEKAKK